MATESYIKLRISVWRDFVSCRTVLFRVAGQHDDRLLNDDLDPQQEVFSWQMREDYLYGSTNEASRLKLRDLLVERFDPARPPNERRFEALRAFIDEASSVVEADGSEWTGSQDPPVDEEDAPYRLNPLLALRAHLEWLYTVFGDQPGVSVSIR